MIRPLTQVKLIVLSVCILAYFQINTAFCELNKTSPLDRFRSTECTSKERRNFELLLRDYRAEGYFIPEYPPGVLDRDAIRAVNPLHQEKAAFIQAQIDFLKKKGTYLRFQKSYSNTRRAHKDLLEQIRQSFIQMHPEAKAKNLLKLRLKELKTSFVQTLESATFLRSFRYPLDHLTHRLQDAELRGTENWSAYFLHRKILEDGTFDIRQQKSDLFLRSALDTLEIQMRDVQFEKKFLSEPSFVRAYLTDLDYALVAFEKISKKPKKEQLRRLEDWKKRTEESWAFYESLSGKRSPSSLEVHWQKQSESRWKLIEFVMKKQAKLYASLRQMPIQQQKEFVLEQILFNEVPEFGSFVEDEKKDVAQVVINRTVHPVYSQLGKTDRILKYLEKEGVSQEETKKYPWLNVLFKEGEFSFSYFYMLGVFDLFCHQSKKDKNRASTILAEPSRKNFPALRYYSRNAMVGRVAMEDVWNDYLPVSTMVGSELKKPFGNVANQLNNFVIIEKRTEKKSEIKNKFSNKGWQYWGYFSDLDKHLVNITSTDSNKFYWWKPGSDLGQTAQWWTFRNPDQFRFLVERTEEKTVVRTPGGG